jgi:hypothetical protein
MSRRVLTLGAVGLDGGITISHREKFVEQVQHEFCGMRVMWTVEKTTRSLRQNALLWWWESVLSQELGWDKDYVHYYNKERFNLKTESHADKKTGEMKDVSWPGDTHDMPVDAFNEYLERVQRGWAEEGYDLPWPDEYKEQLGDQHDIE